MPGHPWHDTPMAHASSQPPEPFPRDHTAASMAAEGFAQDVANGRRAYGNAPKLQWIEEPKAASDRMVQAHPQDA